MSGYFITGTDTGVGKTWVTLALIKMLQDRGKVVVGMKPVASGCQHTSQGLRNDDAEQIIKQSSKRDGQTLRYATVNPYAFELPAPPHIAAALMEVVIDIEKIVQVFNVLKKKADVVVVEGLGGWSVPLGDSIMLADLVHRLHLPVILVVGVRLGCINHALSTVRTMVMDGVKLYGWISSQMDKDFLYLKETVMTLEKNIHVPLLGSLPYMENYDLEIATAQFISI